MKLGKISAELKPSPGNPRNSEGAFIRLTDGTIMFCFSKFIGESRADDASSCIAAVYSYDEGESFCDEKIIFSHSDFDADRKCKNVMSVSLMRMADGAVGLFFLIRYGYDDMGLYLLRSYDEGKSWSEPKRCISTPGYYVTNNDRVVRLNSGRLIVPANFHRMSDDGGYNSVAFSCFFLSDDDGQTWRESKEFCCMQDKHGGAGLQETGIVQLKNEVLWAFSRTTKGYHYGAYSFDGGERWTVPVQTWFTGPCSPLSVKRISNGMLMAVWNPLPFYATEERTPWGWGRTSLVMSLSDNDGERWMQPCFIEDCSENAGYCYTAIYDSGQYILTAYCAGGEEDGNCLSKTRIKKITYDEINEYISEVKGD